MPGNRVYFLFGKCERIPASFSLTIHGRKAIVAASFALKLLKYYGFAFSSFSPRDFLVDFRHFNCQSVFGFWSP